MPVGVNRTWVKYIEKGAFPNTRRLFSVMRCNHCDDAPCVEICPVTALFRRADGIVDFDNRRCIGCKACMQACPYDALYVDPAKHTAAKCNYCAHRIDVGLEPACVVVCPTQAIISGDLDDPNSRISQIKSRTQVSARKVEKGTMPALFYIDGDVDSLDPLQTETQDAYLWSQQNRGVGQHAPAAPDHVHPLDRLGELLSLGETDERRRLDRQKLLDTVLSDQSARRAYDAPQKGITWGWQVTSYLWTKGISAGVLLLPLLAQALGWSTWSLGSWLAVMLTSLVFLALTGVMLVADLEQPKRFLYVLLRPQWRSWLVKGAYIITAFSGAIFLHTAIAWLAPQSRLEWMSQWLLIGLSAMTAMYTAFLFAQARGRDFWQSPVLPIQMLAHSIMLGAATLTLAAPFSTAAWNQFVIWSLILATLTHLSCDWIELNLTHSTRAAKQAAEMMTRGRFRWLFWGGNVVVGGVLPILLCLTGWAWVLPLAGLMIFVGVYVSQHLLVYVPQQLPLS